MNYQPDQTPVPEPIATMMYWEETPDWQARYWAWYAQWHGCRKRAAWAWVEYPYRVWLGAQAGGARLLTNNQTINYANT